MKNWKYCILTAAVWIGFGPAGVSGAELNDVKLPDTMNVDGKTLNLNGGPALRTVQRFGFTVKVYVGALYTEKKNSDATALVKNDELKRFVMHYVRPVDKSDLVDGFREAYEATCMFKCEEKSKQFGEFAKTIVSVRKDNEIVLTFYPDKIEIDTNGPNAKKATINDADLSRNMLAVYVGEKTVAGKKFRETLLGL